MLLYFAWSEFAYLIYFKGMLLQRIFLHVILACNIVPCNQVENQQVAEKTRLFTAKKLLPCRHTMSRL